MIGKRLRNLRESRGITQKELGLSIAIGNVTLSQYENNTRTPDIDTLVRIANYFSVTTDYLLGLSDDVNHGQVTIDTPTGIRSMSFGSKLKDLRLDRGWTQDYVGDRIGVSGRVVGYYESDNRFPKNELTLIKIANLFGVSMDYLIDSAKSTETSILNNRLREMRKTIGMTQADIADRLGITKSGYGYYEQGRSIPDAITLSKIASILGVTTDYLLGTSDEMDHGATIKNPRRIPVLGSVRAGIPVNEDQDIIDWEEISDKMARTGDYFGLVVRGDSMAPALYEGDVLIVRKQPNVENGETAIVCVNGDEHTVKRVRLNPDGSMILMANNALYAPIIYTAQEVQELPVTILGKVVEFRRKL